MASISPGEYRKLSIEGKKFLRDELIKNGAFEPLAKILVDTLTKDRIEVICTEKIGNKHCFGFVNRKDRSLVDVPSFILEVKDEFPTNFKSDLVPGSGALGSSKRRSSYSEARETQKKILVDEQIRISKATTEIGQFKELRDRLFRVKELIIERVAEFDRANVPYQWRISSERPYYGWLLAEERRLEALVNLNESENIEMTAQPEIETPNERLRRMLETDLRREIPVLFFEYLFQHLVDQTDRHLKIENAKQAKLIEYLTGYSEKQTVKLYAPFNRRREEIADGSDQNEKFVSDLSAVRKLFQNLGLTDICDRITRDLGEEI